jgi:hypothetical protein
MSLFVLNFQTLKIDFRFLEYEFLTDYHQLFILLLTTDIVFDSYITPDQLIKNCFWDVAKDASATPPVGRWKKYTPRHVCHYVMDHILSVRYSSPEADVDSLFTTENFKKVLGRACVGHRRFGEDD